MAFRSKHNDDRLRLKLHVQHLLDLGSFIIVQFCLPALPRQQLRQQRVPQSDECFRFTVVIESCRDPLRSHSILNRFHNHFVLLNGSQPADARIVREAFIIIGDDAVRLGFSKFLQRKVPEMASRSR